MREVAPGNEIAATLRSLREERTPKEAAWSSA
jgi:hypothetical protein